MFCPFCGNNNAEGVKFCGKCGGDLQSFTSPKVAAPVRRPAPPKAAAPRPPKPAPVPRERKPIDMAAVKQVCLQVVLSLLYLGMAALILLFYHGFGTIEVLGDASEALTVQEFYAFLTKGNFLFHPTAMTVALSVATAVLVYAAPAFAALAVVGVFLKKKHTSLHVAYAIVAMLAAAVLALTAPLCLQFVPQFKEALALQFFVLAEGIEGVAFSPLWVIAAVPAVWVIVTSILLAPVNRKKV